MASFNVKPSVYFRPVSAFTLIHMGSRQFDIRKRQNWMILFNLSSVLVASEVRAEKNYEIFV